MTNVCVYDVYENSNKKFKCIICFYHLTKTCCTEAYAVEFFNEGRGEGVKLIIAQLHHTTHKIKFQKKSRNLCACAFLVLTDMNRKIYTKIHFLKIFLA